MWIENVAGYVLAGLLIWIVSAVSNMAGKKGLSASGGSEVHYGNDFSHSSDSLLPDLDFNTSEKIPDVLKRGLTTFSVYIAIYLCVLLYWIPDAVDPAPLKVFVTVLGLAILVPYAMGIFGACGCAKDRQEKGIARIQELTSIAKYYRACRRYELEESAGYFGPSETNERKWHFGKNVSTAVQYIFQNAKDGDELYFFDKTSSHEVAACKRSQSVVVYRKDEDIVVGGGLLNSRDF